MEQYQEESLKIYLFFKIIILISIDQNVLHVIWTHFGGLQKRASYLVKYFTAVR